MDFLVASPKDMERRRIVPGSFDAIIVSGDAYVDHPSFGAALIGRWLEAHGYQVAILARPDPDDPEVFRMFGKPKLAFLVTAGALDSMVSSYTANKKPRSHDEYAPGGDRSLCLRADGTIGKSKLGRVNARPDRAAIVYSNLCRQAYKGVPIILGGIEASLRRLAHYDYWSDTVRRSLLLDAKADLLLYGMAERQILKVMEKLAQARKAASSTGHASGAMAEGAVGTEVDLRGIRGTVWAVHASKLEQSLAAVPPASGLASQRPEIGIARLPPRGTEVASGTEVLPAFEEIQPDTDEGRRAFARSFKIQYRNTDPWSAKRLIEPCGDRFVIQEPPEFPLSREELDTVYELPYHRAWHPMYDTFGGVPALAEVKFSLNSSRGCFGACSFCALTFHEGRVVTSRSIDSIVREAQGFVKMPDFKGYIHDVGGPTANFRAPACAKMASHGACVDRRCLAPAPCPNLEVDHSEYRELLRRLRSLPGIKKVFIRSGIRFDYLMLDRDRGFFRDLVEHHISGQLKVAPEHVSDRVLELMGKPPHTTFDRFVESFHRLNAKLGKKQYLVPYFISSHPGATLEDALELALYLKDFGFVPDQVQDFYPTPGTLSTAMWRAGMNPLDGRPVYVPRGARERALQRALLQFSKPENLELVREALRILGRTDLIGRGKGCLVPPQ
jgi:uncharacterized radical SAM protein YgiQ